MKGFLVLEDEKVFEGRFHGSSERIGVGEVVFNTSLTGYQEILTDPSYFRQIIVMTAPEQGNYGVSDSERESSKIWADGFVCVNLNESMTPGRASLSGELEKFNTPCVDEIDTRSLTIHLRSRGSLWGAALTASSREDALKIAIAEIQKVKSKIQPDWVYQVSVKDPVFLKGEKRKGRVAVIDYGVKTNILKELQKRFSHLAVFNCRATFEQILDWNPDGILLTNGPGDPSKVELAVDTVKSLLGVKPVFGICMGHQILALALGGKTFKLKFGHRGGNHPVRDLSTGEIYMTSQNHGYAVDPDLPSGVKVSQINLYDQTIEGIEAPALNAWSIQYHPEASPGPHDARVLFDRFSHLVIK